MSCSTCHKLHTMTQWATRDLLSAHRQLEKNGNAWRRGIYEKAAAERDVLRDKLLAHRAECAA